MKKIIPVFDFALGVKEKEFVNNCLETSLISQGSYVKVFSWTKITTDCFAALVAAHTPH